MAGGEGVDPLSVALDPAEAAAAGLARRAHARARSTLDEERRPARRGRLARLRGRRVVLLLLADGDGRARRAHDRRPEGRGHGHRLVRSPVGRLHRRRGRRLGLVRGQPRRRDGPHALPRSGCRRFVPARVRHARRRGRRTFATCDETSSPSRSTGRWISPNTNADYPAGWRIEIPSEDLVIDLTPTVADQELDTRATTGVVYWEGSQVVLARRGELTFGGEAYVELTGYGPAGAGGP